MSEPLALTPSPAKTRVERLGFMRWQAWALVPKNAQAVPPGSEEMFRWEGRDLWMRIAGPRWTKRGAQMCLHLFIREISKKQKAEIDAHFESRSPERA